jgi:hypothetical protein
MVVKIEYPKCIYRDDGSFTVVRDKEEHDKLASFFPLEAPDHSKSFVEINISSALQMLEESKSETKSEKKDLSKLSWNELRALGKELMDKYGVEIPLRASREQVELKIQEVLIGYDNKRPD